MVVGLGFVPSLGVIHTGTDRSFVYDIADLYKAEITIPSAFNAVASGVRDPHITVRRVVRDAVVEKRLMPRIVKDLKYVMDTPDEDLSLEAELYLWTELEVISSGVNWAEQESAT
ncbi:hypothetical protein GCM10027157_10830 [Corynebacterium aquatimens]|uniref:CRISPR/Cas system-associated endonuclease Cas1 n=1 Tax=Corynebacterium aquatimens TaxID=1190508 RepID=A0A931GSN2_9CORY|nr:CRISPR/Cas system-associated endonuclease Cas1 [Corynebacterium aquatimens]